MFHLYVQGGGMRKGAHVPATMTEQTYTFRSTNKDRTKVS